MASPATKAAEFLSTCPNILAPIADITYMGLACISAVAIGAGAAQFWNDRRVALAESTAVHAKSSSDVVKKFHELDADSERYIAQNKSESKITEDQSRADIVNIQEKTKAELNILRAKEKGLIQQTRAREGQEIFRAEEDTKYALQEQETTHRTTLFSNLEAHLNKMTELTEKLAETTNKATGAAETYESSAQHAHDSILELSEAMEAVIAADLKLQNALDDYDDLIAAGDDAAHQEHEIRKIIRQTVREEAQLETSIASSKISHQSELKQAFTSDLAEKSRQFDTMLGKYSQETLTKLSELVQQEITAQQEEISGLSNIKDIGTCREHLNKLLSMQSKMDNIILEKSEENDTSLSNRNH